ncbi:MAG: hypothetical protein HY313_01850 [Acidobacteria bacterium]|nr:hypothetical protein [Acidobacteriota bacterium]
MLTSRLKFGVTSTLLISGGLPLAGSILIRLYFSDWYWFQEHLHMVAEATGAFIALIVAVLLLLQMRVEQNATHYIWVSSARSSAWGCSMDSMRDSMGAQGLFGRIAWLHWLADCCSA